MKRNFKIFTLIAFLALAPMLIFAQTPPHPGGGNPPGPGNNPVGASVGDGIFILITMAVAYGSRKIYIMRTSAEAEKA